MSGEFGFVTYAGMSGKGNELSMLQLMSVAYISRMILTTKPGEREKERWKERIGC